MTTTPSFERDKAKRESSWGLAEVGDVPERAKASNTEGDGSLPRVQRPVKSELKERKSSWAGVDLTEYLGEHEDDLNYPSPQRRVKIDRKRQAAADENEGVEDHGVEPRTSLRVKELAVAAKDINSSSSEDNEGSKEMDYNVPSKRSSWAVQDLSDIVGMVSSGADIMEEIQENDYNGDHHDDDADQFDPHSDGPKAFPSDDYTDRPPAPRSSWAVQDLSDLIGNIEINPALTKTRKKSTLEKTQKEEEDAPERRISRQPLPKEVEMIMSHF